MSTWRPPARALVLWLLAGVLASRHTLKHTIAALAVVGMVLHLRQRTIKQA